MNLKGTCSLEGKLRQTWCVHACVLSHFGCVQLFATPWTVALQALLSTGFSRQEYCSGFPCPSPGDLPDPGTECESPASPALQPDFLPLSHGGSTDQPRQHIKKQRHYFAEEGPSSQSYGFSSGHVWMRELNHKES